MDDEGGGADGWSSSSSFQGVTMSFLKGDDLIDLCLSLFGSKTIKNKDEQE